jgi:hypothetical protein
LTTGIVRQAPSKPCEPLGWERARCGSWCPHSLSLGDLGDGKDALELLRKVGLL